MQFWVSDCCQCKVNYFQLNDTILTFAFLWLTFSCSTVLNNANTDYQVFTEKSLADVGMPWQSSAIGDGKLCLTAGKPQSGAACGKSAAINMCLEVAQHCSTSSTPIYCVGFLLRRFRCATPAVKHSLPSPMALLCHGFPTSARDFSVNT